MHRQQHQDHPGPQRKAIVCRTVNIGEHAKGKYPEKQMHQQPAILLKEPWKIHTANITLPYNYHDTCHKQERFADRQPVLSLNAGKPSIITSSIIHLKAFHCYVSPAGLFNYTCRLKFRH